MLQKPFVIEDGHIYYPKKPLYKQPLFWTTLVGAALVLVLSSLVFIMGIGLIASESFQQGFQSELFSDDYWTKEYREDRTDYSEYEVGKAVNVDDRLEMTVTSLGKDDKIALVDEWQDVAVVAEVTIKNTSEDDYYFDETYFALQDGYATDYELDLRTYDVNIPEKIAPGETIAVQLIFGADDEEEYGLRYSEYVWRVYESDRI